MIPTAWPSTTYQLLRPKARLYEGFITPIGTPSVILPRFAKIQVDIDTAQSLQVTLRSGTYSELLTFTPTVKLRQTTQQFPGLTSFTTSIVSNIGGLAISAIDPSGRPIHFNHVLETRKGYFAFRAQPIAYSILGRVVQSEATLLKNGGIAPIQDDLVSAKGATYSVVRAPQIQTFSHDYYYQVDLQRLGREGA